MLFLAVFCGFLAEYQLEHKIEKDREKDYMKGMLADLSSDTSQLNEVLSFSLTISKGLDSLSQNLYQVASVKKNTADIYRQFGTYTRRFAVRFSDQTGTQLRNSGQLRLIRKNKVVSQISQYWMMSSQIENIQDRIEQLSDQISYESDGIINSSYFGEFTKQGSWTEVWFIKVLPGAELMNTEKNKLISLANKLSRMKRRISSFYQPNLSLQKNNAVNLITLIKKEYGLD